MHELDPQVKDFLDESAENLDRLDRDFVALEQDPHDRGRLSSVFRTIHTIKGTCGFFGFTKLEAITHTGENLLSRLRDGELLLTSERTTALLAMVDAVRVIFARIAETGGEGDGEYAALLVTLARLTADDGAGAVATHGPTHEPTHGPAQEPAAGAAPVPGSAPEHAGAPAPEPAAGPADPPSGGAHTVEELARAYLHSATPAAPTVASRAAASQSVSLPGAVSAEGTDGTVRIGVPLLDRLMTLVGELVLARNQILQHTAVRKEPSLARTTQRLSLITTELQEGVMKTRMQPIATVWSRLPRVVRDLAAQCGKQVRLEMEGQDTELDRTVIEAIKDPLTHVVRNSIDHGIEAPERRHGAGKPAEGRLLLRAFHEGGQVNIEIGDDGGGINPDKVKAKALERGLIDPGTAARMSEAELAQLIFLPGFSTADKVSNISGRGVGMDVVRTNIEKIGGTVELHSRFGHGTTLRIKIPLTLAIIPALVVTSAGQRYCIPQVNLLELVRLSGEVARRGVETVHSAPVYRLRDRLLPLVDLAQKLGRPVPQDRDTVNIVVLRADQRPFGLVVDGVCDTEEIVVKPLSRVLKGVPVFAGATIMGDGKVALILDVPGVAKEAAVVPAGRGPGTHPEPPRTPPREAPAVSHLLIAAAGARRVAIPLNLVSRLEEVPGTAVETADGQEVIQYRGAIMPVVRLGAVLGGGCDPGPADGPLALVVYAEGPRAVALVVDQIIDVAEAAIELTTPGRRPGVLGSGVVQGRVTDLLDLPAIVRAVVPEFAEEVQA